MEAIFATLFGPEELRLEKGLLAPLLPDMVRVRFGAGGICGSDLHYFRHARTGDFIVTEPLVLGHEVAGEVVEVGDRVTTVAAGDRVAINPSRWCDTCRFCRAGRANLCENIYFMGSASKTPHMQGGFATHFDVTTAQCVKVPDHVSFAAAALAEPLAVALHAVARAGDARGASVAIFGAGPIGLLILLAVRRCGIARAVLFDIAPVPLALADALGADEALDISAGASPQNAYDICFEASGTAAGLSAAIHGARRGGCVVQVGNLQGGPLAVPANAVMAKELDLRGVFRFGEEFAVAVRLISRGEVDVERLVTATRPLADAPSAFRLALDRAVSIKVVLTAD